MTTLFTRISFLIIIGASACLGAGTALAQKAATKSAPAKTAAQAKEKPLAAEPGKLEKDAGQKARVDARLNGNPSDTYLVLLSKDPKDKKIMEEIAAQFPVQVKATDSDFLRLIMGEPGMMSRIKTAYPELTWMTADQFLLLGTTLQANPGLVNPGALEKLKAM